MREIASVLFWRKCWWGLKDGKVAITSRTSPVTGDFPGEIDYCLEIDIMKDDWVHGDIRPIILFETLSKHQMLEGGKCSCGFQTSSWEHYIVHLINYRDGFESVEVTREWWDAHRGKGPCSNPECLCHKIRQQHPAERG